MRSESNPERRERSTKTIRAQIATDPDRPAIVFRFTDAAGMTVALYSSDHAIKINQEIQENNEIRINADLLSEQAIAGAWIVRIDSYGDVNVQLPQERSRQLIENAGATKGSRISLERELNALREPGWPKRDPFNCRFDVHDPLPPETDWSDYPKVRNALSTLENAVRGLRESRLDFEKRLKKERREKMSEIASKKEEKMNQILWAAGTIVGRTKNGYFVSGAVLPVSNRDVLRDPSVTLNAAFFISGSGMDVVAGAALMPTYVVFRGLIPATNAFGARIMVNSYSSNLSARQMEVVSEVKRLESEIDEIDDVMADLERRATVNARKERRDLLMIGIQYWRLSVCYPNEAVGTSPAGDLETVTPLPFGPGMQRPTKLSGRDPQYTRDAIDAKIEGLMVVRCVIELDGKLDDCKIVKGLPYMDVEVLDALSTHTYTPVMLQGRPQRVYYTFNINMTLPR